MTLLAIDHVQLAMPAGGEAAARTFYAGLLGLNEVDKPAKFAKRGGCWFEDGDIRVHLGVDPDFRAAHKAHPAFVVDDLASFIWRLAEGGYTATDDDPLPGQRRAFVSDPFGNWLELIEFDR